MSRPGPLTRIACFICGEPAILDSEKKTHIDYDCPRCGRLRVTGRAFHVFPPRAMAAFDRTMLSDKVQQIPTAPQHGNRRLVEEHWLHRWRLVRIMTVDHDMSEAEAVAHIERHPGAELSNESLLALLPPRPAAS